MLIFPITGIKNLQIQPIQVEIVVWDDRSSEYSMHVQERDIRVRVIACLEYLSTTRDLDRSVYPLVWQDREDPGERLARD